MNQKSIVMTMSGLLVLFSAGLVLSTNQAAADTFGKLAFGTLISLGTYLQTHKD